MDPIISEEKEYLEFTKEVIKKGIENCLEIDNSLQRESTKLSFEDRLRGTHFNLNANLFNVGKRREKLEKSKNCPYFGRFDYKTLNGDSISRIYIGKFTISNDSEIVVYDWRTPICELYYSSEVGPVSYTSPSGTQNGSLLLKRQITIKDGELINVLDTNLVTDDELLLPYLTVNADNRMKTIIASIQKEQNDIIRSKDDNIIIQGVAGSGKTSVALHRIAYLIYFFNGIDKGKDFLVIGPNNYFLNYISSILPDLETTAVEQKTILDILNEYLGLSLTLGQNTYNKKTDIEKMNKRISAFKGSLEYRYLLDKFIKKYFEGNKIVADDFKIDGKVVFSADDIKESLIDTTKKTFKFEKTSILYKSKFKQNIENIYDKLNREYRQMYMSLPKDDPLRNQYIEKSLNLRKLVYDQGAKLLNKYLNSLNRSCLSLYVSFICELKKEDISLTSEELKLLQKETLQLIKKKQVQYEDVAGLIYLNYILTGKKLEYKNVVIDEAQDYSLFAFYALKQIMEDAKFNIYGDLAQAVYPYRSISSWDELNEKVFDNRCNLLELNKSYRTTMEITNIANHVLETLGLSPAEPVIRYGAEVQFVDISNNENIKADKIMRWIDSGYKTVAVICKDEVEAQKVQEELLNSGVSARYISNADNQYSGKIFVVTALSAKGLEFDCTIINNASSEVYDVNNEIDMHLLYIATTRALHEQVVVYNKEIVKPFKDEIKNNDEKQNGKALVKIIK